MLQVFLYCFTKCLTLFCILLCTNVIAHYDSVNTTIHHVECPWKVPSSHKTCEFCKKFCDSIVHSALSKLLRQQELNYKSISNATISNHTNYSYLSTPEKVERF